MYIEKTKRLKILTYCTMAIVISSFANVASAEDSSDNTVNVNAENYNDVKDEYGDVNGGSSESGMASNNILNVSSMDLDDQFVNGGCVLGETGSANGNTVTVRGVTGISFLHGGFAQNSSGSASGNTVNVYNSDIRHIHGGHTGSGVANNNTVNFFSGNVSELTGAGYAYDGETSNNNLNVYGGTLNGTTQGGYISGSGNALNNNVDIKGGTITGNVYGGFVGGSGDVSSNNVNIYGGKITGDVYGGSVGSSSSTLTNNAINILPADDETTSDLDLTEANLYAGSLAGNTNLAGSDFNNSLNIRRAGVTAQQIGGFDTLNFYIPSDIGSNTMLTLTNGATDLTQTTVNITATGQLDPNSTISLLKNQNTIDISNITNDGVISQGVSLDYTITNLGLSNDRTELTATVGDAGSLKKQVNILNSPVVDSISLLDSGIDRLAEWLPPEGLGESIPTTRFNPFAGLGGSVFKIKTSDGQKLESKNAGLDVGMARFVRNGKGMLVFGPITDYGQDSYESNLTHPRSEGSTEMYTTNGSGSSKYFAAGIIARQMTANNQGMYYEGSIRGGMVHTNFSSDNFLVHDVATHADYSASTPCFAGHVRIGWAGNIGGTSRLDAYGIYSLNRINGFDTTLSTGENYSFSAVNSGRARVGARLTRDYKDKYTFYSGLACVHEFTGETYGEYLGRTTNRSGLDGTSGLIELGWRFKQMAASNTMLDLSMVGWVGHQKGVTFSAKYKRDF